jgi:hypothetical protein
MQSLKVQNVKLDLQSSPRITVLKFATIKPLREQRKHVGPYHTVSSNPLLDPLSLSPNHAAQRFVLNSHLPSDTASYPRTSESSETQL